MGFDQSNDIFTKLSLAIVLLDPFTKASDITDRNV